MAVGARPCAPTMAWGNLRSDVRLFFCFFLEGGVGGEVGVGALGVGVDDENEAGQVEDGAQDVLYGHVLKLAGCVLVDGVAVAVEEEGEAVGVAAEAVGALACADAEPLLVASAVVAHHLLGLGACSAHDHGVGIGEDALVEEAHVGTEHGTAVEVGVVRYDCPDGTSLQTHLLERGDNVPLVGRQAALKVFLKFYYRGHGVFLFIAWERALLPKLIQMQS